jgi:hypothetical protein
LGFKERSFEGLMILGLIHEQFFLHCVLGEIDVIIVFLFSVLGLKGEWSWGDFQIKVVEILFIVGKP